MEIPEVFQQLAIALGLGLLVGLQRERSVSPIAGIRTFPLATMFGTLCGLLAHGFGGWIVGAGLLAVAALLVMGNVAQMHAGEIDPGLTTEVAVLVMFALGAVVSMGHHALAVVASGTIALLLYLKPQMHGFTERIGEKDLRAIMQFVVIALVILPVLPDATFGPLGVLNPRRIWWLVVLISGISLAGYVAAKLLGARGGAAAAGLLGGLISSTATTASYARQTRGHDHAAAISSVVIILAGTVVFLRVIFCVGFAAPSKLAEIAPPMAAMFGWTLLLAGAAWALQRNATGTLVEAENPTQWGSALVFTALFAIILLAVAAAREYFGDDGMVAVAVLSGLADMDAITLSTAALAEQDRVQTRTAWRLILIASVSNLVFKASIATLLGSRALAWRIWLFTAASVAGAAAILALWP